MIAPARRFAARVLTDVTERGAYADYALHGPSAERLEQRDRSLATELVYGTLRWQGRLDFVLAGASARSWDDLDPAVRTLLRLGLYQLWHMDRIPAHAALFDSVELAKRAARGSDRFVNAVLRRLDRARPWKQPGFEGGLPPWVRVSLPEWLWARWSERFGSEAAAAYALTLNDPPKRTVRLREGRRGARVSPPAGLALSELVPGAAFLLPDRAVEAGLAFQDEASQLVPQLLGNLLAATAWDACAAPGGKSAILLDLVGPEGRLIATEIQPGRMALLRATLGGTLATNWHIVQADAAQPPPFRRPVDAVLVDVPCTGLGTLRRNPEIKWRARAEDPGRLATTQLTILSSAAGAVRPGGAVLYSTCSTEPEENEGVVERFVAQTPGYRLERLSAPAGVEQWLDSAGMLRTFPSTRAWDGFFAARIVRDG